MNRRVGNGYLAGTITIQIMDGSDARSLCFVCCCLLLVVYILLLSASCPEGFRIRNEILMPVKGAPAPVQNLVESFSNLL